MRSHRGCRGRRRVRATDGNGGSAVIPRPRPDTVIPVHHAQPLSPNQTPCEGGLSSPPWLCSGVPTPSVVREPVAFDRCEEGPALPVIFTVCDRVAYYLGPGGEGSSSIVTTASKAARQKSFAQTDVAPTWVLVELAPTQAWTIDWARSIMETTIGSTTNSSKWGWLSPSAWSDSKVTTAPGDCRVQAKAAEHRSGLS